MASSSSLYRELPAVDELLRGDRAEARLRRFPRSVIVAEARAALEEARRSIAAGNGAPDVEASLDSRLNALARPSLRPVINASGVVLHTNLGRAPLGRSAVEAVQAVASGYANLEYDLERGRRGRRDVHAGIWLERLLGAPALVVNNNAAAIFLVLNELSQGGETIVSRGELVEIGDGFRIPEILEKSGARLREVGTTNRTHLDDYRRAFVPEQTHAILRVHPSNFRITGFEGRPDVRDLAALGAELGVPVVEDLGSGLLYPSDLAVLDDEPTPAASLSVGVDLVTFSGDKLLGGPQAGLIAGKPELIARIRRNPLFRALRADKMVYAALEAVLRAYVFERWDEIPALAMLRAPLDELRRRAESWASAIGDHAEAAAGEGVVGGGSTPSRTLASWLVSLQPPAGLSAAQLERRLRTGDPAVAARIEGERVLLDPRTVFPEQDEALIAATAAAISRA